MGGREREGGNCRGEMGGEERVDCMSDWGCVGGGGNFIGQEGEECHREGGGG